MKYSRNKIRKLPINIDIFRGFNESITLYSKLKLNIDKILFNNMKNSIAFNEAGICKISSDNFLKLVVNINSLKSMWFHIYKSTFLIFQVLHGL